MKYDRALIEKAVETYPKGPGRKFVLASKLSQKQLSNAIKHIDKYIKPEEVVAFLDNTLFSSGKEGVIITLEKIASSDSVSSAAYFENFIKAEADINELKVWYSENSSRRIKIKTYANESAKLLNTIVKLRDEAGKSAPEKAKTVKAEAVKPAPQKKAEKTDKELFEEANEHHRAERYKEALALYEKLANKGYVTAQGNCGIMYYWGSGAAENKEKAFYWFEKAAKNGSAVAAYNLGVMYNTGDVVKEDKKTAFYWFEKSAERGYDVGQFLTGKAYANGEGTKQDYGKAVFWLEKAADQGNAEAQKILRTLKQSLKEEEERKKEEAKPFVVPDLSPEDLFYYAEDCSRKGMHEEAFLCYEKAAEKGDPDSQYEVGYRYYFGKGTKVDYEKALFWLGKAADYNYASAMCLCAEMLLGGKLGSGKEEAGVDYIDAAIRLGSADAQRLKEKFSDTYEKVHKAKRKRIESDPKRADEIEIAAITKKTEKTRKDIDRYNVCYEKAVEGDTGFMLQTAEICEKIGNDSGSEEKLKEAFFWAAMAAEEGNPSAAGKVAKMFEEGIGVPIHFGKALEWYERSSFGEYEYEMLKEDLEKGEIDPVPDPDWVEEFAYDCLFEGEGKYELAYSFNEKFDGLINLFIAAEFDEPNAQCYIGKIYHEGFIFIKPNIAKAKYWLKKAGKNGNEEAFELLKRII